MAEISVIVPVYKVEQFLSRCIDSIIKQTYKDFELILVDDGSPDCCGSICDEYAKTDSRIHVIHQKNGGLSAARNTGIDWTFSHSESKWLSFIDSDDWIHSQYLELLLSAAIDNKTDISIGGASWTKGEPLPEKLDAEFKLWRTEDYYRKETVNATVAWGKLYKKECFHKIRYPVGKIHEDEFITYRILFEHQYVSVVDATIYAYYQNDAGIMKRKWTPARLDAIDATEEQVRFFVDNDFLDIAKQRFKAMVFIAHDSRINLLQCEQLTAKERNRYISNLRRKLRRNLFRYKGYGWLPVKEYIYTQTPQ